MKKVLSAIGKFFVAIWNWIKNTAWIQPLLIVGIIFGIIFSISPITKQIQSWQKQSESLNFFKNHTISYTSKGNDGLAYLRDNVDEFVLIYYEDGCSNCETVERAAKKYYSNSENKDKKIYTINIDSDEFKDDDTLEVEICANLSEYFDGDGVTKPEYKGGQSTYGDSFNTPTMVKYEGGDIVQVRLGVTIDKSKVTGNVVDDDPYTVFANFVEDNY